MDFSRWWVLPVLLLLAPIPGAFADGAWKADAPRAQAAFEKETGQPLRPGHRVEPTVFPGYYAVRSGAVGAPSAYFREDMVWTANVRAAGWTIGSATESSPEGRIRWLKEQVRQLPLERLILVKRNKPPVAVIWSAPDCPFCRRLEEALEKEGVSAYVAPVGLSEEGYQRAAAAYCAKEPGKAWSAAMLGKAAAGPPRPGCAYPRDMLGDIGFFFGQGRLATPIVVFADGSTVAGWDDQRAPARLREKIAQQIYFSVRER